MFTERGVLRRERPSPCNGLNPGGRNVDMNNPCFVGEHLCDPGPACGGDRTIHSCPGFDVFVRSLCNSFGTCCHAPGIELFQHQQAGLVGKVTGQPVPPGVGDIPETPVKCPNPQLGRVATVGALEAWMSLAFEERLEARDKFRSGALTTAKE